MQNQVPAQQVDPRLREIHRNPAARIETSMNPRRSLPRASVAATLALMAAFAATHSASIAAANTYVVNTAGDPGPAGTLSLRQAVTSANAVAGNKITFDPILVGATITLATGGIDITRGMTIYGLGEQLLTISGNDASRIFNMHVPVGSFVHLEKMTLTKGRDPAVGGAIFSQTGGLTLYDVTISDSHSENGGGIFAKDGDVGLERTRILRNHAIGSGGGIVVVNSPTFSIVRSTVDGNTAAGYGAGLYAGSVQSFGLTESTISNNTISLPNDPYALQGGGGAALKNVYNVALVNSTIANNYAGGGGPGLLIKSTATGISEINFCTISGNNSPSYHDAGLGVIAIGRKVSLLGSIVAGNVDGFGNPDDLLGAFQADLSVISNAGSATLSGNGSTIGVDPHLSALADHGGPTFTMVPAANSIAVDALSSASFFANDQRGVARPVHVSTDIGAVERQFPEDLVFRDGFFKR